MRQQCQEEELDEVVVMRTGKSRETQELVIMKGKV